MINYTEIPTLEDDQLEKWYDLGKNLLVYGEHGVGKTSIIKNFWEKKGIKGLIFSGATLDPWTDLLGIPKIVSEKGKHYFEYALPKNVDDNIEAIFIDEVNRSSPKVRNFLLEIIQFRSINGRKFPNLKVVWAAANPPDSQNNYDVEELDPAFWDRFDIIVKLSNEPHIDHFSKKYGEDVAKKAISWHKNLPNEVRGLISPRRLDGAINYVLNQSGSARDYFPHQKINVSSFVKAIKANERLKDLNELVKSRDEEGLKEFFKNQVKMQGCMRDILSDSKLALKLAKYGDAEHLFSISVADKSFAVLVADSAAIRTDIAQAIVDHEKIHNHYPEWYSTSKGEAGKARNLGYLFEKQILNYSSSSFSNIKVSPLQDLLAAEDAEEFVSELNCPNGLFVCEVNEETAKNSLEFVRRIFALNPIFKDQENVKKLYSLLYTGLNYYYNRDGNLIGACFDIKGLSDEIRPTPTGVLPTVKNSMGAPAQRRGRKVSGVQVEELI